MDADAGSRNGWRGRSGSGRVAPVARDTGVRGRRRGAAHAPVDTDAQGHHPGEQEQIGIKRAKDEEVDPIPTGIKEETAKGSEREMYVQAKDEGVDPIPTGIKEETPAKTDNSQDETKSYGILDFFQNYLDGLERKHELKEERKKGRRNF